MTQYNHSHRPSYPNVRAGGGRPAPELQPTAILARRADRNVAYRIAKTLELLKH